MINMIKRYAGYASYIAKHIRNDFMFTRWLLYRKLGKKFLTVRSKQGTFKVSTSDWAIGYQLFTRGEFEYQFSLKAMAFLRDNGFVGKGTLPLLDVGANIGVIGIGLFWQHLVSHVFAFEPVPGNYRLLVENARLLSMTGNMNCFNYALGDRCAKIRMELSPDNPGDHRVKGTAALTQEKFYSEDRRESVEVNMTTLDNLTAFLPPLNNAVLWIDVQGYEGFVFKGGRKFLSRGVPTVSEIWPYGILRAGMTLEEFTEIVSSIWTHYWVLRGERFIRYPISMFDRYLDEVGTNDNHGDIIFTKET